MSLRESCAQDKHRGALSLMEVHLLVTICAIPSPTVNISGPKNVYKHSLGLMNLSESFKYLCKTAIQKDRPQNRGQLCLL